MNICPRCLKPLGQLPEAQPGQLLICPECGEFLGVSDDYALTPADPRDLLGATQIRFAVLVKKRCAILQRLAGLAPK